METVKVKKDELLKAVRENREKHREIVTEAFENYRKQAIAELDQMISEAKAGRRIRRSLDLVEPMDQTKEYDQAIRKLEMSVDDVIELDDETFRHLVCDDWRWKAQFSASNRSYSDKVR